MSSINPLGSNPPNWLNGLLDLGQTPTAAPGVVTITPAAGTTPAQPDTSSIQGWLEAKLGSPEAVTQLRDQIRAAVTEVLQKGGSGADVRAAVDGVLQKNGINPADFHKQVQASGGHHHGRHHGYNAQGQSTGSGAGQSDPTGSAVPPGVMLSLDPEQRTQA